MPPYLLALLWIFTALFLMYVLYQAVRGYRRRRLLLKVRTMPFPPAYRRHLLRLPHYRLLDGTERHGAERAVLLFVHTKRFVPVQLELTDEMRVVIAFYACLIVLRRGFDYPQLQSVYVYAEDFLYDEVYAEGGIYTEERAVLEGQSSGDAIVLSWPQARREAYHSGHRNVIIHECAHVLDMLDGAADGVPPLDAEETRWARQLYREYDAFADAVSRGRNEGRYGLIDDYGATNAAEFFAVTSELFFMRPHTLKVHFPALYNLLYDFYAFDTAETFGALANRTHG